MNTLNIKLLGYPEVRYAGERLKLPTQKVQAILSFLAIKRQASREELADLLWEVDSRHRLRPELHRLKGLPGADTWLNLDDTVIVQTSSDLEVFERHVRQEQFQAALEQHPEKALLLQGFNLEDAPHFMDWLEHERARVLGLYRQALHGAALQYSRNQQYHEALDLARHLIELDPLDESAYRLAMRLEYARGHVQAALQHFETCRRVLAEELQIAPHEETLALAGEIQRGNAMPAYQIAAQPRLPQSFLRPPLLVAREAEWARMEAAYQEGKAIFLSGPAGVGKTRLMLDFASSKGEFMLCEGRNGDKHVPFSSASRLFQRYLQTYPDRPLGPWVLRELSRFLNATHETPSDIPSAEDKSRLMQATMVFFKDAMEHLAIFPTDNMHHFDALSAEITNQAVSEIYGQGLAPGSRFCAINTLRSDEMTPAFWQGLEHFIAQGLAIHIKLEPLGVEAIARLLLSLGLEDVNELAVKLHKLTAGNPQFVMETLKSLHATGQLEAIPERIELPERLGYVLGKRLDGLSRLALRVARTVATLEYPLSTEALAALLELDAFEVAEASAELEQAQVFVKQQFVHDLLQEAARKQTPTAVQRLLHRRMARMLEAQSGDAARIAHHFLAADEPDKALPWRLKSIEDAISKGFRTQASGWLETLLLEASPESKVYAQALILKGRLLLQEEMALAEQCFQESLNLSQYHYPALEVEALEGLSQCARQRRDYPTASALLERALQFPLQAVQQARLFHAQGIIHSQTGQTEQAEAQFQRALELNPSEPRYPLALATLRWYQGRFRENVDLLLGLLRDKPELAQFTLLFHHIGAAYWMLGQVNTALEWMNKSLAIWQHSEDHVNRAMTHLTIGSVQTSLGHFRDAEASLREAQKVFEDIGIKALCADAQVRLAFLYSFSGQPDLALELAQTATAVFQQHPEPFYQSYALACLGSIYAQKNDPVAAQEAVRHALYMAEQIRYPLAIVIALTTTIQVTELNHDLEQAKPLTERCINLAHACGMLEFWARALIFKTRQTAHASEKIEFAKQALDVAERNGLAPIALEASNILTSLGLEEYEPHRQAWLEHLQLHAKPG